MQNQPLRIQVEISLQILGRIISLESRLFHLTRIQVLSSSYILGCFYLLRISVEKPFRKVFPLDLKIGKNKQIIYSSLNSPTTNWTEWAAQKRTGYNRISLCQAQILCRFYIESPTVISYPTSFLGVVSHVRIKFLETFNKFIRAKKICFTILFFLQNILVKIKFLGICVASKWMSHGSTSLLHYASYHCVSTWDLNKLCADPTPNVPMTYSSTEPGSLLGDEAQKEMTKRCLLLVINNHKLTRRYKGEISRSFDVESTENVWRYY